MLTKISLWAAIVVAVLWLSASVLSQSSSSDKIKTAVQKIGLHSDITVVRSDDQWFYGSIEQIDSGSFTIYEIEQKQRINFSYDQVKQVFKGYGAGGALQRDVRGHRIPPHRHHIGLAIATAVIAAVIVVAVVALKKD